MFQNNFADLSYLTQVVKFLIKKRKKIRKSIKFVSSKTLDNIGGDIIRNIPTKNINTIYDDFEKLRNNINDGLYQIGKQFSDSYYTINKEWDYLSLRIGTSIE